MSTPASPTITSAPSGGLDPADAAAGEVVYSSDGLAPLEVTKPSLSTSTERIVGDDEVVLDSEHMPAELAFEVFQGKIYTTAGGSSGRKQNVVANDDGETTYAELSALEKLALLQQQVTDLEAELKTTAADSGRAFDEHVVQLAGDLKNRLAAASASSSNDQSELSSMIRKQLGQVQDGKPIEGSPAIVSAEGAGGGAVTSDTTVMEERVLQLERILGNSQGGGSSSGTKAGGNLAKSLLQRLEEMESLVSTVDTATMEQTATKAKVIRADLEAASKARSKLSAAYKKEDTKMIQQLHQQLSDLEGVSDYLPSLVERLSELSGLHCQAATFGGRLDELESTALQMESTVGQIEGGMKDLQSALVGNIQTLEQNMAKLDERLSKLK